MKTLTQKRVIKHRWDKLSVITADMIEKNGYTNIGDYAFYNCHNLTSITIPNSVTNIENRAFAHCYNLTSITIPNSITTIGDYAFNYCTSLTSIFIPNSVTSIGDYVFCWCGNLTSITIPNNVTSIGSYAFAHCRNLTSITIPNSVTYIGNCTFYACRNLTSITIPNSVTSIGYGAFDCCGINLPKHYDDKGRLIAYKGFDKNMQCCNQFQYTEGQTYKTDYAKLCECGFHACTNPLDIFTYYAGEIDKTIHIHEVYLEEVNDEENEFDSKLVAKKIAIGKRLTIEDINKIIQEE